jgi:hypothetical protein
MNTQERLSYLRSMPLHDASHLFTTTITENKRPLAAFFDSLSANGERLSALRLCLLAWETSEEMPTRVCLREFQLSPKYQQLHHGKMGGSMVVRESNWVNTEGVEMYIGVRNNIERCICTVKDRAGLVVKSNQ